MTLIDVCSVAFGGAGLMAFAVSFLINFTQEEAPVPQEFIDAIAALKASIDAIPAKIQADIAAAIAALPPPSTPEQVAAVQALTDQVNAILA